METKQVLVIRKDLNMRKGKMVNQGAHGAVKSIFDLMDQIDFNKDYTTFTMTIHHNDPLYYWLTGIFTKIVCGCDSEEELLSLQNNAKKDKIINVLIQDSGLTEFHGIPTYTALAIGPDEVSKIDKITGHLKLL